MGHYYDKDGNACHKQATKPGSKNKTRQTTVTDARKQNLLPSVTTVFDVISKPFLTEWQIKEALKVAYSRPAYGGENEDEWIAYVREKASQQVGMAADLGTNVHKALENALNGEEWAQELKHHVLPALDIVRGINIKEQVSESITVNSEIGYAGCVDLAGWIIDTEGLADVMPLTVPVIVDFKTKKTKPNEKIEVSETYPWQLAAYHVSKFGKGQRELHPMAKAALVFISSTEPGRVETVWFDRSQLSHAWECFKATHKLWCLRNKFILT
jgi:hypothetical protein